MRMLSAGIPRTSSHRGIAAMVVGVLLVGLAATAGADSFGKTTIDFAFVAGKKECAAGTYEIEVRNSAVTLRPKDGKGESVTMLVITRLGRHDQDTDPELVFDKLDGKLILSEIWLGNEDGWLVASTPRDHEHRVSSVSRTAK
jgi:hypothetical protein